MNIIQNFQITVILTEILKLLPPQRRVELNLFLSQKYAIVLFVLFSCRRARLEILFEFLCLPVAFLLVLYEKNFYFFHFSLFMNSV